MTDAETANHNPTESAQMHFCHTLAYANRPSEKSLGWQSAVIVECDGDFDLRAGNEA